MNKKILYVSDLDGTLLRSNQITSEYTNQIINRITEQGILFSYATARSIHTARIVTEGLKAKIPLITYNGVFIMDNQSAEILDASYFDNRVYDLLDDLFSHDIYPIVYSIIDGKERFSNIPEKSSKGTLDFAASRNDFRKRMVHTVEDLIAGNLFYITCIDDADKLLPHYKKYREQYHCVYQKDIYSEEQWLEIMPWNATKANAVNRLKKMLKCNYVIAFGDGVNDIEMFHLADEAYAVENAAPELKAFATDIIEGNNQDGVAKWLEAHCLAGMKGTSDDSEPDSSQSKYMKESGTRERQDAPGESGTQPDKKAFNGGTAYE